MQVHHVQAFTYEPREGLLPQLTSELTDCGAWVHEQKPLSSTAVELLLEVRLRAALDFYATLAAAGVELTRPGQQTVSALCERARWPGMRRVGEVVTIRIELRFLEDVPLQSLLTTCTTTA